MNLPGLITVGPDQTALIDELADMMGESFLEELWTAELLSAPVDGPDAESVEARRLEDVPCHHARGLHAGRAVPVLLRRRRTAQACAGGYLKSDLQGERIWDDIETEAMLKHRADGLLTLQRDHAACASRWQRMAPITVFDWEEDGGQAAWTPPDFIHFYSLGVDRTTARFGRIPPPDDAVFRLRRRTRHPLLPGNRTPKPLEELYAHFGFETIHEYRDARLHHHRTLHGAQTSMSAGLSSKSDGMRVLRSGDVAKLAGVTVRTLRHYRSIGLLPEPPRDDNGYCSYGIEDLARVLRIKRLASLGFSLEDIERHAERHGRRDQLACRRRARRTPRGPKTGASEPAANGGSEGGQAAEGAGAPPAPSAADKGPEGDAPSAGARVRAAGCAGSGVEGPDRPPGRAAPHHRAPEARAAGRRPPRAGRARREGTQRRVRRRHPAPPFRRIRAGQPCSLWPTCTTSRSFAEVERISAALVERGLLPAMRGRSTCGRPPWRPTPPESEIDALAEEALRVFVQVTDRRRQRQLGPGLHPCRAAHDSRIPARSSTPPSAPCTNALPPGSRRFSKIPAKPLDPDAAS